MEQQKGFLSQVFDFSFSSFIAPKAVTFLYVVGICFAILVSVSSVVGGFKQSFGIGVLAIVIAPLVFAIEIIFIRIWLEIMVVLFKIAENTGRTAGEVDK